MRTTTLLKGAVTLVALFGFNAANAVHNNPCATAGNCMYLSTTGAVPAGGNQSVTIAENSTLVVDVWFSITDGFTGTGTVDPAGLRGGTFDVTYDNLNPNISLLSFDWSPNSDFQFGPELTDSGAIDASFDQFNAFGPGADAIMASLTFDVTGPLNNFVIDLVNPFGTRESTYSWNSQAGTVNCLTHENGGADVSDCVNLDAYSLSVTTSPVPLPAAVWMMLAGIGSLAGFSRRRRSA